MDLGSVGHVVRARVHADNIAHAHSQIPSYHFVHQDTLILSVCLLSDQSNANSLLSFLSYSSQKVKQKMSNLLVNPFCFFHYFGLKVVLARMQ